MHKWREELIFFEEQEEQKNRNKEYILAHNHKIRLEQIALFLKDLSVVSADSVRIDTLRNKLTPVKNLIAMIENGLAKGTAETHDLVIREVEQCKKNIANLLEEK